MPTTARPGTTSIAATEDHLESFNPPDTSDLHLPASVEPPSPSHPPKPLVWLIFGATGHMGRSLTKTALRHNDLVCAVGRTFENSLASMQGCGGDERGDKGNFEERYLGLLCDVRIRNTVDAVIQQCLSHFGKIDIIAVCSGYGVVGAAEDQEEHEIRNQFETNFMGTLNVLQLSLPYFRERRRGRYLVFSSTSGALGVPGLGPYCASKYAVEGLIESMLYEVDAFNIKASLVEIGHLRRDDLHKETNGELPIFGHLKVKPASEPYAGKDAPANHARRILQWIGDKQATSAVKTAKLVWQLGHCSYPPLRLILGTFAVESIRDRLKSITEEIEDWKHLSFSVVGTGEKTKDDRSDEGDDQGEEDDEEEMDDDQDQDQTLEEFEDEDIGERTEDPGALQTEALEEDSEMMDET